MLDNAIVIMRANNGNVVTISPAQADGNEGCCWVDVVAVDMLHTLAANFCHSFAEGWERLESLLDENE